MSAAATSGNGKARRADRDELTDQRVIVRMLEMRSQGHSFRDIATALAKQRVATLSPECVEDPPGAFRQAVILSASALDKPLRNPLPRVGFRPPDRAFSVSPLLLQTNSPAWAAFIWVPLHHHK